MLYRPRHEAAAAALSIAITIAFIASFNARSPACCAARLKPPARLPRFHTMMPLPLVPFAAMFAALLLLSVPSLAAVLAPPPMAAVSAPAQNTAPACLPAEAMTAPLLYGRWAVRYTNPPTGLPATATLVLQRHAEFSESLAGTVTRSSTGVAQAPAALAGDLDGSLLLLDESADKIRITATWNGEIVPGSCGLEFAGLWKDMTATADNSPSVAFTLKKLP